MSNIYLKHPIHGHKVANLSLEVEEDLKHGWEQYELEAPVEALPPGEVPVEVETPKEPAETLPIEEPAVVAPKNRRTTA